MISFSHKKCSWPKKENPQNSCLQHPVLLKLSCTSKYSRIKTDTKQESYNEVTEKVHGMAMQHLVSFSRLQQN
jgi:hypothetical protein